MFSLTVNIHIGVVEMPRRSPSWCSSIARCAA